MGSLEAPRRMAIFAASLGMPSSSNMTRPGRIEATQNSGAPLPLPMRVSAGFLVTGLSGKMRIHILPPRLIERVIATRAASIWRFVIHAGSNACRPNSPNSTVPPRYALPRMRPRCCLRYLTRFGINMVVGPRSVRGGARGRRLGRLEHFAVEDPHLDAARAVGGVRRRPREVDVGPQRVKRDAAVAVGLVARHLRPAQAARAGDADALGARAHGRGQRLLHGAAERDTLLELLRDVLGHQLGVEVGPLDLLDVELDVLLGQRLELGRQLVDLLALPADDQAGTRRADRDRHLRRLALDDDLADARLEQAVLQVALEEDVFLEQLGEVLRLGREPPRVPGLHDPEPEPDRMRFLSHHSPPIRRGRACRPRS